MQTIVQHSLDTNIAKQISGDFQVLKTHIRHQVSVDLAQLRQQHQTDFNYLPNVDFSQIKLFVSDMDSTLITIESIDEIADFANLKPQVAQITERAMQGKLDFNASLIERVALLKGLDVSVFNRVYIERLQVNPGGKALIKFFKTQGIKTAVVSGGFSYFTQRLARDIGLDYARASELGIDNGQLNGRVQGGIINATAKANFVYELCEQNNLVPNQVMVAGDGANDLQMMSVAGVSVAYRAKPIVIKKADIAINFGGLDKIRDFFDD